MDYERPSFKNIIWVSCGSVRKRVKGVGEPLKSTESNPKRFEFLYNIKLKRGLRSLAWRETVAGYLFVSPLMIGLTVISIIPIVASFILSFTDWRLVTGLKGIHFVGFINFVQLSQDDTFFKSLLNNIYLLAVIPIKLILSLFIAILIDRFTYFKDFFKVIFFLPFISSVVAVAIVFRVLFHPQFGPINYFLMSLGVDHPPAWLADTDFALVSIMIIQLYIHLGFSLIIYLAGLKGIPNDLYEAANIDGANPWQKFKNITLPMLSGTTFFLLITGIINSFKIFDLISVLTQGGPGNSTNIPIYYLYETAFINLKTGYASTISLVLFLLIFIITLANWYGQKKWVHY